MNTQQQQQSVIQMKLAGAGTNPQAQQQQAQAGQHQPHMQSTQIQTQVPQMQQIPASGQVLVQTQPQTVQQPQQQPQIQVQQPVQIQTTQPVQHPPQIAQVQQPQIQVQQSQPQIQIQQKLAQTAGAPQIQIQQNPAIKAQVAHGQSLTSQQLQQQLQMQQMQLHHTLQPAAQQLAMQEENEVLSRRKLQELVSQITPNERLDPEVEEVLLELVDDFIESVTTFACNLAKHRNSTTLEVKDLMCHLERNWNIKIPGFGTADNVKPFKRQQVPEGHKQRLNLVKKSLAPPAKQPKLQ